MITNHFFSISFSDKMSLSLGIIGRSFEVVIKIDN